MRYGHRTRPNTLTDDIASALDVRESGPAYATDWTTTGQRPASCQPGLGQDCNQILFIHNRAKLLASPTSQRR